MCRFSSGFRTGTSLAGTRRDVLHPSWEVLTCGRASPSSACNGFTSGCRSTAPKDPHSDSRMPSAATVNGPSISCHCQADDSSACDAGPPANDVGGRGSATVATSTPFVNAHTPTILPHEETLGPQLSDGRVSPVRALPSADCCPTVIDRFFQVCRRCCLGERLGSRCKQQRRLQHAESNELHHSVHAPSTLAAPRVACRNVFLQVLLARASLWSDPTFSIDNAS